MKPIGNQLVGFQSREINARKITRLSFSNKVQVSIGSIIAAQVNIRPFGIGNNNFLDQRNRIVDSDFTHLITSSVSHQFFGSGKMRFTLTLLFLLLGSSCFAQGAPGGGGATTASYSVLADDVRVRPILVGSSYDEVKLVSKLRAYLDICSTVASINPTKTFETWIGALPQGGQAATWNLVMFGRVYGDLENPASEAGKLYQQLTSDSPTRAFEDDGGVQYRYVDIDKTPLAVYSKDGAPITDPDSTWDIEHSFDTALASGPVLNLGKSLARSVDSSDMQNSDFETSQEIVYQTPVPELNSADETYYGLNVIIRFKVSRKVGNGDWEEIEHKAVSKDRRGIFRLDCGVTGEPFNTVVKYQVEREYKKETGTWTDDSGNGSSIIFTVSWSGNCQGTGGQ